MGDFKKVILYSVLYFSIFVIVVECLNYAATKEFGGAEVTDLRSTLASSQRPESPFYHMLQRKVLQAALGHEAKIGSGYDWKVSTRFVPAFSLALGCFLVGLILINIYPLFALAIPILFSCYSHVIWYGAESRSYATWLAVSLVFYCLTLQFYLMASIRNGILWMCSAILLVGTELMSVIQVWTLALLLFFPQVIGKEKKMHPVVLVTTLTTSLACLGLFLWWSDSVSGRPLILSHVIEPWSYYLRHFGRHALLPVGGAKGLSWIFTTSTFFIYISQTNHLEYRYRKFFFFLGVLNLSQVFIMPLLYAVQILKGDFFADQHVIFSVAIRALSTGGMLQVLHLITKNRVPRKYAFINSFVALGLFALIGFDWFKWYVPGFSGAVASIRRQYKSYCHGKVLLDDVPLKKSGDSATERTVFEFAQVNLKRHSAQCLKTAQVDALLKKKSYLIADFSPSWIYQSD